MKLFYKYDFLSRLLQTKKLKKRQVIDVLGNNDYFSLNQWLSGRVPVNINGIIKICNHFNIGLENFICDSDNVSSNSQIKDEPEVVSLEYNSHFLRSFMIDNNLTKKDLLEALGSSDYKSINSWLDGKTPIHICAMLRLCNYYGMPLDGFFLKNGEKTIIRPLNDFEAQKHPTNNYGLRNGRGRKIIETFVEHPQITSIQQEQAVAKYHDLIKYQEKEICSFNFHDNEESVITDHNREDSKEILKLQLEHEKALRIMEQKFSLREIEIRRECAEAWAAERMGYLTVIEQLKNQLAIATGTKEHLILNKMRNPKQHLNVKDLKPSQKEKLWDVMKRHGASQGFAYDRFFKEGFEKWELIGTNQMKLDFLHLHSHDIWPNELKDDNYYNMEIIEPQRTFYRTLGMVHGLKTQFRDYAMSLGMGANSVLNHFSSDDWKDFERIGILSIIKEFELEVSKD